MLNGLLDCLKDNIKKQLKEVLDENALNNFLNELTIPQDQVDGIIAKYQKEVEEAVKEASKLTAKSITNAKMKKAEAVANEPHNVQEARKSVKYTEQLMSETKYTKPVDLQDADYTTDINYPHRYGHIDTVKNWWLVDKIEKYIEAVASNGTLFHCDKEGNVSIHITGKLKLIVDGDISIEGRENIDTIIKGSSYTHISGKETTLTDGVVDKTSKAGKFNYTGSIYASGTIIDASGNTNHHSH